MTREESNLCGATRAAAHGYVRYTLGRKLDPYAPNERRQAQWDPQAHCFDLALRIDEFVPVLLEFKHRPAGVRGLPAFDPRQHEYLATLAEAGVLVHYCYNVVPDYRAVQRDRGDVPFLEQAVLTSVPDALYHEEQQTDGTVDRHLDTDQHPPLLAVIDEAARRPPDGDAVAALLSDALARELETPTTELLVLLYNVRAGTYQTLDREELQALVSAFRTLVQASPGRGQNEMAGARLRASVDERVLRFAGRVSDARAERSVRPSARGEQPGPRQQPSPVRPPARVTATSGAKTTAVVPDGRARTPSKNGRDAPGPTLN
jgi:hypothetical protein